MFKANNATLRLAFHPKKRLFKLAKRASKSRRNRSVHWQCFQSFRRQPLQNVLHGLQCGRDIDGKVVTK